MLNEQSKNWLVSNLLEQADLLCFVWTNYSTPSAADIKLTELPIYPKLFSKKVLLIDFWLRQCSEIFEHHGPAQLNFGKDKQINFKEID